jgi:hypothetical protein
MWYYGGMDVPFVDPTLINNNFGLGTWNYGLTTPFFGTPKMTWGDVNYGNKLEVLPLGGLPYYGTPHMGYNPFVNTFINPLFQTNTTPFFGLNNILPTTWGTPLGFDKLSLMKMNWGYNPFFTNGTFGYSPMEELYKSTLGWTLPFNQFNPFTNLLGQYGTPYGISNINPFFFGGIEDKFKFQTPFTTGSYGLFNTFNTFNTPLDWKMKTFGTPVGMTTETWNKPLGFPWKSSVLSGPVGVL